MKVEEVWLQTSFRKHDNVIRNETQTSIKNMKTITILGTLIQVCIDNNRSSFL